MPSVPKFKAAFHGALGFQELSQEEGRYTLHLYPPSSPQAALGEGLAVLPSQQKLPSCLDNG